MGGSFSLLGKKPDPSGRLEVGVLAATLLDKGSTEVPLFNSGAARLENLSYEVEGPFEVSSAPLGLDVGERSSVVLTYQGKGGASGYPEHFKR